MINNFSLIVKHKVNQAVKKNCKAVYVALTYLNSISPYNGVYIDYKQIREILDFTITAKKIKESIIELTDLGLIKKSGLNKYELIKSDTDREIRVNIHDYLKIKSNYDMNVFMFLNEICFFKQYTYFLFWNRIYKEFKGYRKFYRAVKRINKLYSLNINLRMSVRGVYIDIKRLDNIDTPNTSTPRKTKANTGLDYKKTKQYKERLFKFIDRIRKAKKQKKDNTPIEINNHINTDKENLYTFENPFFNRFKERFSDIDSFKNAFIEFVRIESTDSFTSHFLEIVNTDILRAFKTFVNRTHFYLNRFYYHIMKLTI